MAQQSEDISKETQDESPSSGERTPDLPQTPLGGTDPTAPNAPSYAEIAVEHSPEPRRDAQDDTSKATAKPAHHDLPTTPLGGTDPTADGAPSYADMAVEPAEQKRDPTPPGLSRSYSQPTSPGAPLRALREPSMTDDLPHTPLGGHDPTAPGAFSYAAAAHE